MSHRGSLLTWAENRDLVSDNPGRCARLRSGRLRDGAPEQIRRARWQDVDPKAGAIELGVVPTRGNRGCSAPMGWRSGPARSGAVERAREQLAAYLAQAAKEATG